MKSNRKSNRSVTIKDVAKAAGVSISTVSRIINNMGGVSEELEVKVKKAIKDLNYRPNVLARALKSKTLKSIGLIIPSIINPVFPPLVKVIEDTANNYGFSVILCNSDGILKNELKYISLLAEKQVDGIIINSIGLYDKSLDYIISDDIPVVVIGRKVENFYTTNVTINNYSGAYKMTSYLIEQGLRKIAFVYGDLESKSAVSDRLNGYKQALADAGIEYNEDIVVMDTKSSGKTSGPFDEMLSRGVEFDAIFSSDDIVAIGCIDTLFKRGYRVPEDISVAGFGDIFMSSIYRPSLTTVRVPIQKLGKEAVKAILRIIYTRTDNKSEIMFEPELIIRDSTRKK